MTPARAGAVSTEAVGIWNRRAWTGVSMGPEPRLARRAPCAHGCMDRPGDGHLGRVQRHERVQ